MSRITVSQFFVMLFLCRVFTFFTAVPGVSEQISSSGALVFLPLCAALCALAMLPAFFLLRGKTKRGILEAAYSLSPLAGKVCALLFLFCSLFLAADSLTQFGLFLTSAVYPEQSGAMIVVLFCLTAAVLAMFGLESTARMSGFVLFFLLLSLALIFLSLSKEMSLLPLVSPLLEGTTPIVRGTVVTFAQTSELLLLLLFLPRLRGRVKKGFALWLVGLFLCLLAVTLGTLVSVGGYAQADLYPLYATAKSARLFSFQRMDALHIVIWSLLGLIKTALWLLLARHCALMLFPHRAISRMALPGAAAVSIVCSLLLLRIFPLFRAVYTVYLSGAPLFIVVCLVPLLLLLFSKKQQKNENGEAVK